MAKAARGQPIAGKPMRRLTQRAQFLRTARGRRSARPAFVLQSVRADRTEPGLGFTVTKRTGNAVERNRIRRRLRAAADINASLFQPGHDYVLIGRREALHERFDRLVGGMASALEQAHTAERARENRHGR